MNDVVGMFTNNQLPNSAKSSGREQLCGTCDRVKPIERGIEIGGKFKCADCYMRRRRSQIAREHHAGAKP